MDIYVIKNNLNTFRYFNHNFGFKTPKIMTLYYWKEDSMADIFCEDIFTQFHVKKV